MSRIVDFYNVRPDELEPGDVMVCTVTLHITHWQDANGNPCYRVYRCAYPPQTSDGIPQGGALSAPEAQGVALALFPVTSGLRPGP